MTLPTSKTRTEFLRENEAKAEVARRLAAVEAQHVLDGRCARCGADMPMWRALRRMVLCCGCDG